jgi:hypothetical protein
MQAIEPLSGSPGLTAVADSTAASRAIRRSGLPATQARSRWTAMLSLCASRPRMQRMASSPLLGALMSCFSGRLPRFVLDRRSPWHCCQLPALGLAPKQGYRFCVGGPLLQPKQSMIEQLYSFVSGQVDKLTIAIVLWLEKACVVFSIVRLCPLGKLMADRALLGVWGCC